MLCPLSRSILIKSINLMKFKADCLAAWHLFLNPPRYNHRLNQEKTELRNVKDHEWPSVPAAVYSRVLVEPSVPNVCLSQQYVHDEIQQYSLHYVLLTVDELSLDLFDLVELRSMPLVLPVSVHEHHLTAHQPITEHKPRISRLIVSDTLQRNVFHWGCLRGTIFAGVCCFLH